MSGDLNAKHMGTGILITKRGRILRDNANESSYLIYGPDTVTTIPYNRPTTPDVLNIFLTRDLFTPVYLT